MASRSVECRARSPGWLGAAEGKNYFNSARSSEGGQAGRAADFIDSIDPKQTSGRRTALRCRTREAA